MPAQDLFVTLGVVPTRKTMQLQAFDLSNPASGMRVLALTGVPLPLAVPGLDYCPDNGALYAYLSVWGATLNTLYKITPPASNPLTNPWTVTTQTLGGVAIPNPTYADGYNGVYSKFRYVRRLRSFAFLNRTSDPVYIMRPTDL